MVLLSRADPKDLAALRENISLAYFSRSKTNLQKLLKLCVLKICRYTVLLKVPIVIALESCDNMFDHLVSKSEQLGIVK